MTLKQNPGRDKEVHRKNIWGKSHSGMINYCFYVGSFVDFCLEALICGGLSFWGAIATDDHWLEQGSMDC